MEEKTKVLILGASGIIGAELVRQLCQSGYMVTSVSRSGRSANVGERIVRCDVYNKKLLQQSIGKEVYDVVIDLLSFNKQDLADNLDFFKGHVKQYIFISSATVYDAAPRDSHIKESSPKIKSGWSYAMKKIEAEEYLLSYCKKNKIYYTIARPYITFSEKRIPFGLWEGLSILHLNTDKVVIPVTRQHINSMTTITSSEYLAKGITALVMNKQAFNEDFNITNGQPQSWEDYLRFVAKCLRKEVQFSFVSEKRILHYAPELRGKVIDRSMDRAFDNTKILKLAPELRTEDRCEQDRLDKLVQENGGLYRAKSYEYQQIGKMDRLVSEYSNKRLIMHLINSLFRSAKQNPRFAVSYIIGYSPLAKGAADFLRKSSGRESANYN